MNINESIKLLLPTIMCEVLASRSDSRTVIGEQAIHYLLLATGSHVFHRRLPEMILLEFHAKGTLFSSAN